MSTNTNTNTPRSIRYDRTIHHPSPDLAGRRRRPRRGRKPAGQQGRGQGGRLTIRVRVKGRLMRSERVQRFVVRRALRKMSQGN